MPIIWRFVDGKAGHERQTAGFIDALERVLTCEVYEFDARHINIFSAYFTGKIPGAPDRQPDLIIGAGSASQAALLVSKKAYGGKTIYFMRPKYPASWFDLCIIPHHDAPPPRENILISQGVLNDCRPADTKDDTLGVILVGGPSRHHAWDSEHMVSQIKAIVHHASRQTPGLHYQISTSRRTPSDTVEALRHLKNVDYLAPDDTGPQWLPEILAQAANVWVSADSVSMMYEALSSGACLGVLNTPVKRDDRITKVALDLVQRGLATSFEQWQTTGHLQHSPTLQEAERIAKLVIERFALTDEANT